MARHNGRRGAQRLFGGGRRRETIQLKRRFSLSPRFTHPMAGQIARIALTLSLARHQFRRLLRLSPRSPRLRGCISLFLEERYAGVASNFSALAISLSSFTGLLKYSLTPRLSAYILCRAPWFPLIMITNGLLFFRFRPLIFSRTRNPPPPGSIISSTTRSGP